MCFVANVGDSRAVMSSNGGAQVSALSQDHKPCDPTEYQRIIAAGGQVYQTTTATSSTDIHGKPLEQGPTKSTSPRTNGQK
jgi:protein phosphatase PTC2/3